MYYYSCLLALAAFFSTAHAHAVIIAAAGDSGPDSQGFLVDPEVARNCTTISPCQQDSTIIRDSEITQNIVNFCGRTELNGNIDVGEQTENELALNRVTQVSSGGTLAVTLHQVNADGAGPFECDLDQTSNASTDLIPLKVSNNVPGTNGLSDAKEQEFTIQVQLPEDMNCIGASTGDVCTVRCRNNALAGPFGGCVAVQQTDGTGRTDDSAAGVDTAQELDAILAQVQQNQKDFDAAVAANQAAGAAGGNEGASAISALITATVDTTAAAATGNANNNNNGATSDNDNNGDSSNDNNNGIGNGNGGNQGGNNQNSNANNAATNNNNNANGFSFGNGNGRNRAGNNRRALLSRFLFGA